jgi:hypothetical protein
MWLAGKTDYGRNEKNCKLEALAVADELKCWENGKKAKAPTSPKVGALPFSLSSHKENQ